jgi:hypothetical protein
MRIDIHASRLVLSEEQRQQIHRRASFALSRLASRIVRVEVLLQDINGPRGGIDKRCRVLVHLDRGPAVVVEKLERELTSLIDHCFARAGRALHKRVQTESAQRFLPRHLATRELLPPATAAEAGP